MRIPQATFLVLRHQDREYSLVSLRQALSAKADFGYFYWDFASSDETVDIRGRMTAPAECFVGLNYYNPPGGIKHCLNTKIGSCTVQVVNRVTGSRTELRTDSRALMEILTDDREHGVTIRA